MAGLDPRVNAFRPDLAAAHLAGRVDAPRFVEGRPHQVARGRATLHRAPSRKAPRDSELLFGERVAVYEERGAWAWVQNETDGYVGYVERTALRLEILKTSHRVRALRTFLYAEPDPKAPVLDLLSLNAGVTVAETEGGFSRLASGGWVYGAHLAPEGAVEDDHAAVALRFLGTPYLWGGRTSLGLDCSALVQMALMRCGIAAPRDTDMQEAALGEPVDFGGDEAMLERGDVIYWKGHTGIWVDCEHFVHANASDMMVSVAPFSAVAERIARATGDAQPRVRRPRPVT